MGLKYDEFEVGAKYTTGRRTIRECDIQQFAGLSGDFNPLHTDEQYVAESTPFKQCIAHGALTFAISTGLSFQSGLVSGTTLAFLGTELSWKNPVYPGDTVHMEITVLEKRETSKPDRGIVIFGRDIYNQDGKLCMQSKATLLMKR